MTEMRAHIVSEAKLLFRDPISWLAAIALPSALLLIFGAVFAPHRPHPALGGQRWIDTFAPSLVVITTATLAIQTLPIRLATYREKGILRRFSTTPARPAGLLIAQLVIYTVTAILGLVLLVVVGRVAFDIPLPADPVGYVAAFGLGMAALLSMGLLLAAVAPSSRTATAIAVPLFFVVMFLGGVYLPRYLLPEVLITIGAFTPPGVQGLQDAWMGTAPQLLPLAVLGAITVAAGALAVRVFRWE
jgi:ABC-2 type transport system permease protein